MSDSKFTILINDGEKFEGSIALFQDCFFSNATFLSIQDWCRERGYTFAIKQDDEKLPTGFSKIHMYNPNVRYCDYSGSPHVVDRIFREETNLCWANTDRVTKNPEEVTCIACQRKMKEHLLDYTEELLEALKRNQEVLKAVQEQHGNSVLILPAVWPHEITPHVEIHNNQKLIDKIEGK